jgi:predicted nucleic acid-binding protein
VIGGTLVDSDVLLDILTADAAWREWSTDALVTAKLAGDVWINPVVYAEVSVGFSRIEDLDRALGRLVRPAPLPLPAAFLTGKVYLAYRRNGGTRPSPLPDFFIGAHAAVAHLPLITRDPRRYRTYFSTVPLITP